MCVCVTHQTQQSHCKIYKLQINSQYTSTNDEDNQIKKRKISVVNVGKRTAKMIHQWHHNPNTHCFMVEL